MNRTDARGSTAQNMLRYLNSSSNPTFETILLDVERCTSKPVFFHEVEGLRGRGATGLWYQTEHRHVIIEPPPVSDYHRRFVRFHEIGHIISTHLGLALTPDYGSDLPAELSLEEMMASLDSHQLRRRHPNELLAEAFAHACDTLVRRSLTQTAITRSLS